MIYLIVVPSLAINGLLVWYIRKLLGKFWFQAEARSKFTTMLTDYQDALKKLYQLEELHGEESIKKAIEDTNFVIEACEEYKKILNEENSQENSQEDSETEEDGEENTRKEEKVGPIRLREGEKVTQSGDSYRRVITDNT
jgi:hypothetical protein